MLVPFIHTDVSYMSGFDLSRFSVCCSALSLAEETEGEYLTTVTDKNLRKTLTMYRLSDHSLAVEKDRHHQTWLPREDRLCCHCDEGAVETELHFLTQCHKYRHIKEEFFPLLEKHCPEFGGLTEREKLPFILGEKKECAVLAAKYVFSCRQQKRQPVGHRYRVR